MATYVITGKSSGGVPLVSVNISAINQEERVVEELAVVGAVRQFLAGTTGVQSVVAQKYEQVITVV
jgi:hypothetical protein